MSPVTPPPPIQYPQDEKKPDSRTQAARQSHSQATSPLPTSFLSNDGALSEGDEWINQKQESLTQLPLLPTELPISVGGASSLSHGASLDLPLPDRKLSLDNIRARSYSSTVIDQSRISPIPDRFFMPSHHNKPTLSQIGRAFSTRDSSSSPVEMTMEDRLSNSPVPDRFLVRSLTPCGDRSSVSPVPDWVHERRSFSPSPDRDNCSPVPNCFTVRPLRLSSPPPFGSHGNETRTHSIPPDYTHEKTSVHETILPSNNQMINHQVLVHDAEQNNKTDFSRSTVNVLRQKSLNVEPSGYSTLIDPMTVRSASAPPTEVPQQSPMEKSQGDLRMGVPR